MFRLRSVTEEMDSITNEPLVDFKMLFKKQQNIVAQKNEFKASLHLHNLRLFVTEVKMTYERRVKLFKWLTNGSRKVEKFWLRNNQK